MKKAILTAAAAALALPGFAGTIEQDRALSDASFAGLLLSPPSARPAPRAARRARAGDIFSVDPKIRVNPMQDDMDAAIVLTLAASGGVDALVRRLAGDGYDAKAYQDGLGGFMLIVQVPENAAAAKATALAGYAFVREVLVSRKVFAVLSGA